MFEYYKNKRKKPFISLLITISILIIIISLLVIFLVNKNNKIISLNQNIQTTNNKLNEMTKQINIYQGMMIEYDVKYNSYYTKLREKYRENYNLTKYQKRYYYFMNPVENEEEAFTAGANSEYGKRNIFPYYHQGTDLQVIGKIINPADGIVYKIGENKDAGKYLVMYYNIQGREHLISFYHCNQRLVKKGDRVKMGQELAKYGSTGNSSGPHNHFALYTKIDGIWYSENFYMDSFHKNWCNDRYKAWSFVYEL